MYDIGPGLTLAVRVVGGSSRRSINIRMISKFARRYGWPRGSEIDATAATQRRSLNAGILRVPTTTPRGKAMRRDASKSLKNERERVERLAGRCLVLSNSRECCPAMVSILSSIIIPTIPLFALVITMEGERRLLRNTVDV